MASAVLNFYLAEKLSGLVVVPMRSSRDNAGASVHRPETKRQSNNAPASAKTLPRATQYSFDRKLAEDALSTLGRDAIFQPLRAYVEKTLNDTVPGTIDKGNLDEKKPKVQVGKPAKWYVPLPLREGAPEDVSNSSCIICNRFRFGSQLLR